MIYLLTAIPCAVIGVLTSMLGYSPKTWQFWMALLPVALATSLLGALLKTR